MSQIIPFDYPWTNIFTIEHVEKIESFLQDDEEEELEEDVKEGLKLTISKMAHVKKSTTLYKLIK